MRGGSEAVTFSSFLAAASAGLSFLASAFLGVLTGADDADDELEVLLPNSLAARNPTATEPAICQSPMSTVRQKSRSAVESNAHQADGFERSVLSRRRRHGLSRTNRAAARQDRANSKVTVGSINVQKVAMPCKVLHHGHTANAHKSTETCEIREESLLSLFLDLTTRIGLCSTACMHSMPCELSCSNAWLLQLLPVAAISHSLVATLVSCAAPPVSRPMSGSVSDVLIAPIYSVGRPRIA